jgi:hypothetical protein
MFVSIDQVAGKESYSFTNGFSWYHQFIISEEEKKKTKFITEWGLFTYNVIPFGLNNSPTVFSKIIIATFHDCGVCVIFFT